LRELLLFALGSSFGPLCPEAEISPLINVSVLPERVRSRFLRGPRGPSELHRPRPRCDVLCTALTFLGSRCIALFRFDGATAAAVAAGASGAADAGAACDVGAGVSVGAQYECGVP